MAVAESIRCLEHESMWVREDAAIHLGNIGDPIAIEPLRKLAESQSRRQDGRAAQLAVRKLNRIKHSGREDDGPARAWARRFTLLSHSSPSARFSVTKFIIVKSSARIGVVARHRRSLLPTNSLLTPGCANVNADVCLRL